jgi:hypothetical protein
MMIKKLFWTIKILKKVSKQNYYKNKMIKDNKLDQRLLIY